MAFHSKLPPFFLLLSLLVTTQAVKIEFIHRDSPRSPLYDPSQSRFDRLQSSFQRSNARKSALHKLAAAGKTLSLQGHIQSSISRNDGEYLMKIALGTPPVEFLAIADTGSDLTWTQCKPCPHCYKQTSPLFDPRKSATYRTVSCKSESCSFDVIGTVGSCGKANACTYQYSYGDGSSSVGKLSTETLTFDSNSSFPNVMFGCGHENTGKFMEAAAGLVGLGNGTVSIVHQLSKSIGGKFSYCLTPIDSNATSTISFGPDASLVGSGVVSTPMVKKFHSGHYYLTLEGFSVGNRRNQNQNHRSFSSVEEGNIIIDSGTTLTYLPPSLYNDLESALVESVRGTRVYSQLEGFTLCYKKSSDFRAPPVTAHFKGADVELAKEGTFFEVRKGFMCLTAVPSEGVAIFGNMQQMNYKIGYDIEGRKVDFMATDCSKS